MSMVDEARAVANDARSIAGLFGNAVDQLGKLVQNEVQLAKAEMSQKFAQASMGIAYLAGAAIFLIPVLVMLLITMALWMQQLGFSPIASHLIATAIGAAISGILALIGVNHLKPEKLTPSVTLDQVERDMAAAKELAK